ncbi:P-loop containing nucleoside triphosphate hydrolase protein [Coccomyxa subellipsoidea C-169]|uniref:P-loop containing nucleoside triphosphate hydrolase protein n=1 Tax=Coccomyxa subellipsoidea (strain C-169) TaxID=574566 RepID=I0YVG0_COCSC|nr:P-loop containing nucleoside triphosphate hydrolase protein [Coccomyxa subellipsoidea C-169]EIE22379.1 P-loop containing nucleoside triphosphate hydrolase protein [Coccomyxa subellipsoidea C-169]|eukprot:XP_005646923.1 P-loop containing nucleoside triphosphate hydrolase protein [Coccomyxa subellipsoidea C-169]
MHHSRRHALHCNAVQADVRQVADRPDLTEYIASGSLLSLCGLDEATVLGNIDEWLRLGDFISNYLGFPTREKLDAIQRMRVYQYYLPVYFWCCQQMEQHRQKGIQQPLVIGMQAPQGCGKTTLVDILERLFTHVGIRAASVSIDDFYLTFADQQQLAKDNATNRLLQVRGNAGTHDLQLGTDILAALKSASSQGSQVSVPRYDKSQNGGRGDRADTSTWPSVQGPLDIILFEGWMLGFRPSSDVQEIDGDLVSINEKLREYEAAWDAWVDAWLVVKVGAPDWVYKWRLQAEHAMLAAGKPGMSDEQVADFVDRYMPAYKAYLPSMYAEGPTTAKTGHLLMLEIDQNRGLTAEQPACPL